MPFKKQLTYYLILLFLITGQALVAAPQIKYTLSFPEPQTHYVDVEMQLNDIKQKYIDVTMPVWAPGSYLVREFAKNVEAFSATSESGKTLNWEKIDKNTWRVYSNRSEPVKVSYKVYAYELTVRTSFVDASHAYLNGTSIFMYPEKYKNASSTIHINPYKSWTTVSTALENKGNDKWTFQADNYDNLADSPFEIGTHDVYSFTAAGVKHEVAMYGKGNYNPESLMADMKKIVEESVEIFGELPVKRYVFIIHNTHSGGGGLEHLNSTTLQTNRWAYSPGRSYQGFMGLVAHEYFHLWNVKRLRPEPLGPFNYDAENYTKLLWVSEGFTSFYDDLLVCRAGLMTPDRYMEIVGSSISYVENTAGNKVQAVTESSFDAWIKFYRRNENSSNSEVSYYSKGAVLAMLLNLEILKQTKGEKSLDDVMNYMYERYYKKLDRGFTESEVKAALEKFAGKNLDDFFNKYVNGTETPDYESYFSAAGLKVVKAASAEDEAHLGASVKTTDGKTTITSVSRDGSAWNSGLNVNDEIIAINNYRVEDLNKIIQTFSPGDTIEVLINRDGIIQTLAVKLQKNDYLRYRIEPVDEPTETQVKVFRKWLKI